MRILQWARASILSKERASLSNPAAKLGSTKLISNDHVSPTGKFRFLDSATKPTQIAATLPHQKATQANQLPSNQNEHRDCPLAPAGGEKAMAQRSPLREFVYTHFYYFHARHRCILRINGVPTLTNVRYTLFRASLLVRTRKMTLLWI